MKQSKELQNIIKSIEIYFKKHRGKVQFIGSFLAFEGKDFKVVDDLVLAYGIKSSLREAIKDIDEMLEGEKEELVNW